MRSRVRRTSACGSLAAPGVVDFEPERRRHSADATRGEPGSLPGGGIDSGPDLAAKVAFLSRPESYPEPATRVDAVETHMSWVFLTDRHAYKLKKPIRSCFVDLRSPAARRANCFEELRLNRRLAPDVYLDGVPLTLPADGRMRLAPEGRVIDWLVKMRRLPADRMLDHAIRSRTVRADDIRNVVAALCRFYHDCPPIPLTPDEYRERFAAGIAENANELSDPSGGLPSEQVLPACAAQRTMLQRGSALFDERVRRGRIVEGHGDLRPEHVCLGTPPQIIDCLDFARDLRILDIADELAFLALECERLGAPELARRIFADYGELSGEVVPSPLVNFYQSYRATVRARLALRRLHEPAVRDPAKWTARTRDYLRLADAHVAQCG
jgi:aminoglycoside phosphotransferase family enzyme